MRLKVYNTLIFILIVTTAIAQNSLSGTISSQDGKALEDVEIYLREANQVASTDASGKYRFENIKNGTYNLIVFGLAYELVEQQIRITGETVKDYTLTPLGESLSEVVLTSRREKIFALRSLKKVEGTAIYAGKKSEVVLVDQLTANLAANAPRQIYSQVVGLNIYENGDAGLQLNIGGRGLDPNRSANFNIRQNNYDISADVLGYPESYYTPPAEALKEIQVVRGAASLQYGTQFGGLINFKFREPVKDKKIELISRQTAGSYGLLTSFNSLSGTVGKLSYYTYFNYKEGDGWRPNSQFNSRNYFAHVAYELSERTTLTGELTLFNYLAKQAGGLTDAQFIEDPNFSNRDRNWFDVDWKVYSLRLDHAFSDKTDFSLNVFGLDAQRSAVGFRTNRVSQPDDVEEPRELLVDNFTNWGAEARLLTRYRIGDKDAVFLIGSKYYDASNSQQQGPGTTAADADFNFATDQFPNYERQAQFDFPNKNLAIFGENIFNLTDKFTVTPGFRYEYIKTESAGSFNNIVLDLAGNPLVNEEVPDNRDFERDFLLLGLGSTYQLSPAVELYGNFSQNYRSVTFNDIRVVNPSFVVDEDIKDEEGFTIDVGARGRIDNKFAYDVSAFGVRYDERLGEVLFEDTDGSIKRRRGNIGDAFIYGLEVFTDWNLRNTFFEDKTEFKFNLFTNLALTSSEYLSSEEIGVAGNQVEFIPDVNLKTGVNFGYKNFTASAQYTYLTEQFTDATNAPQDVNDNQRGIEGSIPSYGVLDVSAAYTWKQFKLEAGLNNALDESYFTRRATGYPGPGIIPAEPLTFYTTLQIKL
ncbi:TonB-dependent receptor [Dokdonia donghaensis]|uniref:TonB-dependent receptor n=1 Tax=Dokdonia donghaensis DSW-1 TaxID=1300343 RepID=A0A0A2GZT5_9FLAO|nr:TonB-dependent receptor [Dokdonia donghaensis]ANH60585.1 Fe(3+) dicitrate transport protein FecA precursor [Dokdonia donghaensis DSW-1]KGO07831.1 TonB-dependent receptor [Dokdonia donghaensis DSW-1]